MENLNVIENLSHESNDIFKLDYKGQLLKDNVKFKTFKNYDKINTCLINVLHYRYIFISMSLN